MALTDAKLRSLKPRDKAYRVYDSGGLYVQVTPSGSRLWRFKYRFGGKERLLTLKGGYPKVKLADARAAVMEAKLKLREGIDPGARPDAKPKPAAVPYEATFKAVAMTWLDAREGVLTPRYRALVAHRLKEFVLPELGHRPIAEITAPEILACLRKIEARGTIETAHRVKTLCGQVFRFAIAEGKAARDPSADVRGALKPAPKVQHRAKVGPKEAPALFAAIEDYHGDDLTRNALILTLHTMARTNEVRFAKLEEFELTGPEPVWRIPAERMKMHRPHLIPLSRQMAKLIPQIVATKNSQGFLFGAHTRSGVISENSMLYALYRMGYHSRQTVHGLRGLASTILHEQGFDTAWIETQLAHDDENKVRAAYNAAQYLPQRRKMLQAWSDYIERNTRTGRLLS